MSSAMMRRSVIWRLADQAQRLERLGLAGRRVADDQHVGALAAVQHDTRVGTVEGHQPLAHDGHVVQREDHLLEIAEVAETIVGRHRGDQQTGGCVVVEDRRRLAETRQRRRPGAP